MTEPSPLPPLSAAAPSSEMADGGSRPPGSSSRHLPLPGRAVGVDGASAPTAPPAPPPAPTLLLLPGHFFYFVFVLFLAWLIISRRNCFQRICLLIFSLPSQNTRQLYRGVGGGTLCMTLYNPHFRRGQPAENLQRTEQCVSPGKHPCQHF